MTALVTLRQRGHDLRMLGSSTLWTFVFLWTVLISWLSAQPSHKDDPGGAAAHWLLNTGHAPLFGFWGVGVAFALAAHSKRPIPDARFMVLAAFATLAYGMLDEIHQAFVPGRTSSWTDIVTDLVGAMISLAVLRYVASTRSTAPGLALRCALGVIGMLGAGALATRIDSMQVMLPIR